MLQAYEGYLDKGRVYPLGSLANVRGRRRVIITVLDELHREDAHSNQTAWLDEFNRLLDESGDEKLDM